MEFSLPEEDEFLDEHIVNALFEFIQRRSTSQGAIDQLMRYLQHDPASAAPASIIPMDRMQIRLDLIENIRQLVSAPGNQYQLSFLQLAYLSLIPRESLADFELQERFWCLRIKYNEHKISFWVRGWMPPGIILNPECSASIPRSITENNKCLIRDKYSCVLTGAAYPDVCHIVPFAVNSSPANAVYSQSCLDIPSMMVDSLTRYQLQHLLTDVAGCSDKSWNMICLAPTMFSWWRRCLFALKCLAVNSVDEEHSRMRLQFHWMPRNKIHPRGPAEPTEWDIRAMLLMLPESHGAIVEDSHRISGRPLETGQTFDIIMSPDEAFKMKIMIDVQWVVIRLAAISGLARSWEAEDDYVDYTDWM